MTEHRPADGSHPPARSRHTPAARGRGVESDRLGEPTTRDRAPAPAREQFAEPRPDEVIDRPLCLANGRAVGRVMGLVRRADDLPAFLDVEIDGVLLAHRTLIPLWLVWYDVEGRVRVRRLSRRQLRRLPRFLGERATLSAELEARVARAVTRRIGLG